MSVLIHFRWINGTAESVHFIQLSNWINPLTHGAYWHKRIFLNIFWLDMGQLSPNVLKKAFATWQHAYLSISIAFYDIFARAYAENKILKFLVFGQESDLRLYAFLFFRLTLCSFCFRFAAVIDPLLGLLPVQQILWKHHRVGQFLPWSSHVSSQEIMLLVFRFTQLFKRLKLFKLFNAVSHNRARP